MLPVPGEAGTRVRDGCGCGEFIKVSNRSKPTNLKLGHDGEMEGPQALRRFADIPKMSSSAEPINEHLRMALKQATEVRACQKL